MCPVIFNLFFVEPDWSNGIFHPEEGPRSSFTLYGALALMDGSEWSLWKDVS